MMRGAPLNPFSACFHQPGAVPYRFDQGESAQSMWRRFVANGRRGQIVGAHGTGKSTLLCALERACRAEGESVRVLTLHDGERWPVRLFVPAGHEGTGGRHGRCTLFLDGAEQLAPAAWRLLRGWTRLTGEGLLATAHGSVGLPLLRATAVDRETACWVVETMLSRNPEVPRLVAASAVEAALRGCDGNLREALFRLYDQYEERFAAACSVG